MELMTQTANNQLGMVEESRALSEIKGKIFLAKQFPRNESAALSRILEECKNPRIAESATYEFSRGTSKVNGASIRLAEVIARHWGNLDIGVVELERRKGESTFKTFAWDLESNYRDEKIFTIAHVRDTKKGSYEVTDERDIYELGANNAARRKRACILAVIPSYVVDDAVAVCESTVKAGISGGSIEETREKMHAAFVALAPDVTKEELAAVVNKDFDLMDAKDIVKLRNLYNAVKDGFVKINIALKRETEDLPTLEEDKELDEINDALNNGSLQRGAKDLKKTDAKQ